MNRLIILYVGITLLFSLVAAAMLKYYNYKTAQQVRIAVIKTEAVNNYIEYMPYMEHSYRSRYRLLTAYLKQNEYLGFASSKTVKAWKYTNLVKKKSEYENLCKEFANAPEDLKAAFIATRKVVSGFAKNERPVKYIFIRIVGYSRAVKARLFSGNAVHSVKCLTDVPELKLAYN